MGHALARAACTQVSSEPYVMHRKAIPAAVTMSSGDGDISDQLNPEITSTWKG